MTHEERLALIHKPFFTERFSTGYQWGGVQIGERGRLDDKLLDNYLLINGKRHFFATDWTVVPMPREQAWDGCGVTTDPEDDPADRRDKLTGRNRAARRQG